jgi:excisionase family DNA binding protein
MKKSLGKKHKVENYNAIRMFKTHEASKLLNIHASTLRRWGETGVLKEYRIGPNGHRRYARSDIAALLIKLTTMHDRSTIKLNHQ